MFKFSKKYRLNLKNNIFCKKRNDNMSALSVQNGEERKNISHIKNFRVIESYKQLRTNLMFAMSTKDANVVEFSSSFSGEGKSTTSANIAIVMAETGVKVLLVDSDLRKPVQHRIFSVENKWGVSSVLGKMASFEDVVYRNISNNLDLITSGTLPPNPSELIASNKMKEFINKVQKEYDYVIIDTPPINLVSDALELSKYTGGLVLVTRQGTTTYDDIKASLNSAKFLDVNILGLVINGIKDNKFNGYGKQGKYKRYGNYYSGVYK